jgi:hypothetical protein
MHWLMKIGELRWIRDRVVNFMISHASTLLSALPSHLISFLALGIRHPTLKPRRRIIR